MKNTLLKTRVRELEILSFLLVLLMVCAMPAEARNCGGATACGCGDRVVQDHILTTSLGPCPGTGLYMGPGVTLDGNGNSIQGTGNKAGIIFDEKATGAVVRNLEVSGFKRGIRFAGVRGARLENVQSHHNGDRTAAVGYGVDLARGASENVLTGLRVYENADEGIHFGTNANRNRLEDSEIFDNFRENVYFLQNRGNEVHRSRLHGGGAAAFYVKHAPDTLLSENVISDRPIQIRGRSNNVRVIDNQLTNSSLTVEPFKGEVASGIRVSGGRIVSPRHACVRLRGAREVQIGNIDFSCRDLISIDDGAQAAAVLGTFSGVLCRGPGRLTRLGPLKQSFVSDQGQGVASVRILDAAGGVLAQSDEKGQIVPPVPQSTMDCPGRAVRAAGLRASLGSWSIPLDPGASDPENFRVPASAKADAKGAGQG